MRYFSLILAGTVHLKLTLLALAEMWLALLGFFALASAAPTKQDTVRFLFENYCKFPVYIREAVGEHPGPRPRERCAGYGETQEKILPAGASFLGQIPLLKDSCGHSVKVARKPLGPVYQYEFTWARENDLMWYNLSHEDGNPFTDVRRSFSAHNDCPSLLCEAGNDGRACDYSVQTDCGRHGAMQGSLCVMPKMLQDMTDEERLEYNEKHALKWEDLEATGN
ncbi:hypothetical protein FB567DRAFT_626360 [Paraphoma chrysanthemicola]|uniref:Uncharacterized protein n=1 Tax=Paraphoma chrysanthemicola TaxID=798071 RepID=A0A8K0RAL3_9PLEO|nr:hypothetical protein FB567DRAFT_626360 [Paraphoma chrysanthemicola]